MPWRIHKTRALNRNLRSDSEWLAEVVFELPIITPLVEPQPLPPSEE
jgi:hypothetical protein